MPHFVKYLTLSSGDTYVVLAYVINTLCVLQVSELFCHQVESYRGDLGPLGGAALSRRQSEPAGRRAGGDGSPWKHRAHGNRALTPVRGAEHRKLREARAGHSGRHRTAARSLWHEHTCSNRPLFCFWIQIDSKSKNLKERGNKDALPSVRPWYSCLLFYSSNQFLRKRDFCCPDTGPPSLYVWWDNQNRKREWPTDRQGRVLFH